MKSLIFTFLCMCILPIHAQTNQLKTESVELKNLITFIADKFQSPLNSTAKNSTEKIVSNQVLFLFETHNTSFSVEEKAKLKQALSFFSKRSSKTDLISISTYHKSNSLLLDKVKATDVKAILHAIESQIPIKNYKDGIGESFAYANSLLAENKETTLVFVKFPKVVDVQKTQAINPTKTINNTSKTGNVVLLTAITLLPELINVIKD